MIKVEGVTKYLGGKKILDNVSLNVKKGSIYGLIGPNGAGKTTLIKSMVDIYRPDQGTVLIDGRNVHTEAAIKATIGYIPEVFSYYPQFRLQDMTNMYREIYPTWNEKRYQVLLKLFAIEEKKKMTKLSKGMKTRVSLLLNFSLMPRVFIMDEPTSGLDPLIRKEVLNLIVQDVSQNETTVFISTHNLNELEQICDHTGIINKGKVLAEANIDDMKKNIKKIQVAFKGEFPDELKNHANILKIEKQGKVYYLVATNIDQILSLLKKHDPLLLETVEMTLEEIFIYKMEGEGYDFQNISL